MNSAITQPWDAFPDDLKFEMMLEMLVDDELPESQRAALLRALDSMPRQWRTLALRFLERQTEHASIKEFIASAPPAANYPFPAPKKWPVTRVAAGLALLVGVSAVIIVATEKNPAGNHPVAVSEVLPISGKTMGAANNDDIRVNLVQTTDFPSTLLQGSLHKNSSRTLFIVPQGPDKAAVIPVTTAKEEIIY